MKYINKIVSALSAAVVGVAMLTACEGSDIYSVNSPDWLQEKIDSIANSADPDADVYSFGESDYSSGWWTAFSKTYVVPDGAKWTAHFNLSINPSATKAYQNFALIICSDGWSDRNGTNYTEYGAIRFDTDPTQTRNSEWGDYIDRSGISSNLDITSDDDVASLQKLGGEVTLVVDRSAENGIVVTISNEQGVVKTYTQTTPLANLNTDPANSNIDCFLAVEGSYINFESSNITQVRPVTADQDPVSMTLNDVPDEVLLGSTLNAAMANVTANVTYANGSSRVVPASELKFVATPDFESEGEKTVVAILTKTYKSQASDSTITAMAKVKIVKEFAAGTMRYYCPTANMFGAEDNSTGWWGAHSQQTQVKPRETVVTIFKNYTSGANVWNNFVTCLTSEDQATEYAILRADNYGWGSGYSACTPSTTADFGTDAGVSAFKTNMNGATVTTYITNNGDNTADVKAIMTSADGAVTYVQTYTGIKVAKDNLYARYTLDGCHLVFESSVGASDNSTGWWGAHSTQVTIPTHTAYTLSFTNYSSCANQWNNAVICLTSADKATEYAILRADNYGWGSGYSACTPSTTVTNWDAFKNAMNGAKVDLTVTNNGDGTADVKMVMHGTDGVDYTQTYTGIKANANDLTCRLTVDGCHMTFADDASSAKKFIQFNGRRFIYR